MKTLSKALIICFALVHLQANAQKKSLWERNTLNIYTNGFYSTFPYTNTNNSTVNYKSFQFGFLSLSAQRKLSDHFNREFEFLPIRWEYENHTLLGYSNSKDIWIVTAGSKSLYLETAIRYQINYYPFALKQQKFNPYVGVSTRINFESFSRQPKVSAFKTTQRVLGAALQFSPGFDFKINDALSLMFDIPVSVYSLRRNKTQVDNPAIPLEQQRDVSYTSEFLPVGINFGLGLRINVGKQS